jgi:hypothetical protein
MHADKNLMVMTMTDPMGSYTFAMLMKRGGVSFAEADLAGTWNYVGLISGDAPAQKPGWYWGAFTLDEDGDVISAAPVIDSLGNSDWIPSGGGLDISPTGVVTYPGDLIRGVMNSEKDMIVGVGTMCPGRETAVCGYNLIILMKGPTTLLNIADLEGTWGYHSIFSGDWPQSTGWVHGTLAANAEGRFVFTSQTTNSGGHELPPDLIVSASPAGVLTIAGTDFHGLSNSLKDTVVGVMTDILGGYQIMVALKTDSGPDCLFKVVGDLNDDCKVDAADLALMADNWLVNCLEAPDNPACISQ